MKTRSQAARFQMSLLLLLVVVAIAVVWVWKPDSVRDIYLTDVRTVVLNGAVILLFLLGVGQIYRALGHYAHEEEQVAAFIAHREDGVQSEVYFDEAPSSLLGDRFATIKELFDRGVPINHGAISAIMLAEESLFQSFPKFVHNVLILTGVFGTVSSLIIALLGASDVLQDALPGEGMSLMLLGMNTALTTTATAIVCYFFFTYFYQKMTDVQTWLFSRIERAALVHIIPEYAFDSESINHQTEHLIRELRDLSEQLGRDVTGIDRTLSELGEQRKAQLERWDELLAGQAGERERGHDVLAKLDGLRRTLVDGFRLRE